MPLNGTQKKIWHNSEAIKNQDVSVTTQGLWGLPTSQRFFGCRIRSSKNSASGMTELPTTSWSAARGSDNLWQGTDLCWEESLSSSRGPARLQLCQLANQAKRSPDSLQKAFASKHKLSLSSSTPYLAIK